MPSSSSSRRNKNCYSRLQKKVAFVFFLFSAPVTLLQLMKLMLGYKSGRDAEQREKVLFAGLVWQTFFALPLVHSA
jgi:hypothetical protein